MVVKDWSEDFAKKVREQREKLGMYLEGSIGLPKTAADVATFFADMDIGQLVSWERCLEVITQRAGLSARVIYNVENFAPSADVPLLYNEVAVPFLSLTYVSV